MWNSGTDKMSWEMFLYLSEKDQPLLCVERSAL